MEPFEHEKDAAPRPSVRRTATMRCLIILSLMSFIFLLISIVFITLYLTARSDTSRADPQCSSTSQKYCGSQSCLLTAQDAFKQLNQSVDPCEDFYEYVCGGWENENPLGDGETFVSGLTLAREKSFNILKKALENANRNYSQNEAVMKTVDFFNTCNNTAAVEALGDDPLKKLIDKMGGWNVTGNITPLSLMSIAQRIGKVSRELFIKPFVDIGVSVDPHNSNKHILQVREAYKKYMKKIAKFLGGGPDSDEQMMKVFDLETELAKLYRTPDESSIIETLQKKLPAGMATFELRTTLQRFSSASRLKLENLVDLVNAVFKKQGRKFKKDEKILAYPRDIYANLFKFYENRTRTDPLIVVNYIIWTVINNFIRVMPQKYREARDEYVTAMSGKKTRYRWKDCINGMQSIFGMPLGLLFVDVAFDEKSKETITQMTRLMKDEFIKSVNALPWMSDATKAKAKEKANAIAEDIGYPSYIKDPSKLAATLKGLNVSDNLFENTVSAMAFAADQSYSSLDKPVDRDEYFNYGGIGMVIGHEIIHGFDNSGRFFDKDGNINNWWSIVSQFGFKKRTECLAKQYSQYEVYGKKINGNQTKNENIADNGGIKLAYKAYETLVQKEGTEGALPGLGLTEKQLFFVGFARINGNQTKNENIADNGGIKLAYKAYETLVQKEGTEGALPGLGLTEKQLFFVGFARPWCSIYRKKVAHLQVETDEHTFPKYRIIGTLHNYDKFAEVFNCKPGSAMNPQNKCTLW
ncbi:Endothelin-converting enzyme 1 [Stylophora pistillata]|uniref:Endothelin-converting enzyme 1 n=1 Tax=Stylophora pistillata TaxID=50429 RepID=A0A2B4SEV4_STYPI|nr:Endothelin-converting enzyme 1 [Stylophora pistillata]